MACPAVQVEALLMGGLHCRGLGPFISTEAAVPGQQVLGPHFSGVWLGNPHMQG